jgi:hypothetical protein
MLFGRQKGQIDCSLLIFNAPVREFTDRGDFTPVTLRKGLGERRENHTLSF